MKYAFLDNFRGFSKTLIPIQDVNFLVGENSTGKTSFLSVINLLESLDFWLRQEFNTSEMVLGLFKDISNHNSHVSKPIRIGLAEPRPFSKKKKPQMEYMSFFLLSFIAHDEAPIISSFHYAMYDKEVEIRFTEHKIFYLCRNYTEPIDEKNPLKIFENWMEADEEKNNGDFQILQKKFPYNRRKVMWQLDEIIQMVVNEFDDAQSNFFSFPFTNFMGNFTWIAPIRSKPKRIYDGYMIEFNSEGEHIPHLLSQVISRKRSAVKLLPEINKFGFESNLFHTIDIKRYGRSSGSPFELNIFLESSPLNIGSVGYGVSQILPIVVEMLIHPNGRWFAIQQPEVHLHPRAQAAFGDFLFSIASQNNKKFFIETHSDYVIDRYRMNYRNSEEKIKLTSQVLFFERTSQGNVVHPIDILEDGSYSKDQPAGFRSFFIREALSLLGL